MATSTLSLQSQLFWQQAVALDAGAFVPVPGNTLEMVTHWLFGQVLNYETWSLYNSTQLEWSGLLPFVVFSSQKVYVVKVAD